MACHADAEERRSRLVVSGSVDTNTEITTDGTRKGFFFRTVPPDAIQSTTAANYINKKLKYKRVYIIDDQEAYSTGLADAVQAKLRAAGVTVTRDGVSQQQSDFSSLIAKIPRDTQIVYIPWQLPPKGQGVRQADEVCRQGQHQADGLGRPVRRRRSPFGSATCTTRRSP